MDLLAPALARIARVEAAAADALAPAEETWSDGWRLRFNHGVTRRGNSVLPHRRGRRGLSRKLADVEGFYAERGLRARVQLSPAAKPARLGEVLDDRGWLVEPGARVLWCSTRRAVPEDSIGPGSVGTVTTASRPSEAYLRVQETVTPGTADWAPVRADALVRAGLQPWHLVLEDDGLAVSAVLGVHDPERRMVGLFSLATLPDARGRGAGSALVRALRERAGRAGAEGIYLQVDVRNVGASRLYARGGFAEHHRYEYRVAPRPD